MNELPVSYTLLFNAVTDALAQMDQQNWVEARDILRCAQQAAEEAWLSESRSRRRDGPCGLLHSEKHIVPGRPQGSPLRKKCSRFSAGQLVHKPPSGAGRAMANPKKGGADAPPLRRSGGLFTAP